MAKLLISAAIAGLLALGGTALAQPDDHRGPAGHAAGQAQPAPRAVPQDARPAGPAPGTQGRINRQPSAAAQAAPAAAPNSRAGMRGHETAVAAPVAAPTNAMRGPAPSNAMRGPAAAAPATAMRGPAPGNANRGSRPDFSSYHRNFSAPQHFHAQTDYRRPSGWYARRWTYGEILPSLFWAPDYWLSDYYDFGLMPPPPGTVWVRDGNDALLIVRDTGEIIQVEYSVFY